MRVGEVCRFHWTGGLEVILVELVNGTVSIEHESWKMVLGTYGVFGSERQSRGRRHGGIRRGT